MAPKKRAKKNVLTKKKISIIPISYADEGNIVELYTRITKVMKKHAPNYEIIYVNDNSPDKSQEILEKLAKKDKKLTVIKHSRNFGAHAAFTTGMKQALGDAVIIIEGDVQDPPELLPKFIEKWLEGYDVVYGVRTKREPSFGKFWSFAYHMFYVLYTNLSYVKMPLDAGEFSLMDRKVVDVMNSMPETDRYIRGLRAWVGFKQIGVPFVRLERFSGKGVAANSLRKKLYWVRKAIFNFSFAPLDWVFNLTMFTSFLSAFGIVFNLVYYYLVPGTPRGFLTLLTSVLFIGSVQLVALSIVCDYLRRIFEEVKRRPVSVTESIINDHRKKSRR